jgi:hypothetical protein
MRADAAAASVRRFGTRATGDEIDRGVLGDSGSPRRPGYGVCSSQSLLGADRLLSDVMRERGYPTHEFDQRAADVSVDRPHLVEHYRAAQAIHLADQQGEASTGSFGTR